MAKKNILAMGQDVENLKYLYDEFMRDYQQFYDFLSVLSAKVRERKLPIHDLTDLGFLCRELENKSDELRKDAKARKEQIGELLANSQMDASLTNPQQSDDTVWGNLAYGKVDVSVRVDPPAPGTNEYLVLMKYLGVENPHQCVKFDWKKIQELALRLVETGGPKALPPGLSNPVPVSTTVFTRRRGTSL